jgi:hypothetical protein
MPVYLPAGQRWAGKEKPEIFLVRHDEDQMVDSEGATRLRVQRATSWASVRSMRKTTEKSTTTNVMACVRREDGWASHWIRPRGCLARHHHVLTRKTAPTMLTDRHHVLAFVELLLNRQGEGVGGCVVVFLRTCREKVVVQSFSLSWVHFLRGGGAGGALSAPNIEHR